jgi:hypothetical protein
MSTMRTTAAGIGALALAAGLTIAVPTAASAVDAAPTPAPTTGCSAGVWPEDVRGRPTDLKAGAPAGVWIWKNSTGWHLRVTHDAKKTKVVFSGVVRSEDRHVVRKVLTERNDRLVRTTARLASFRFTNFGWVDGLDIKPGCSDWIGFRFWVDGKRLAPEQIHLGADGSSPSSNGFRITRVPAPAPAPTS